MSKSILFGLTIGALAAAVALTVVIFTGVGCERETIFEDGGCD